MSQDETKRKQLERQLHLSNVKTLLLLDQAGLLRSPLSSALRMQLCWEYRNSDVEKCLHEDGHWNHESFKYKIG